MNGTYAAPTSRTSQHVVSHPGRRYPRRRATTHAERIALIVILGLLLLGAWVTATPPVSRVATRRVLTVPGDTLWTIASSYPVPGLSTQQDVELIAHLNHIGTAVVPTGHVLVVPSPPMNAVALR